jgi:ADP-ribose pyrophosphatase YjhB (NUDIX family)
MIKKSFVRVVIPRDNKILVMKSIYKNEEVWNYPGGKLEENESFYDASKREVLEECGISIEKLKYICEGTFYLDDILWHGVFLLAENFEGEPRIQEPHKCKEMGFKTREEIFKLPSLSGLLIEPLSHVFQ